MPPFGGELPYVRLSLTAGNDDSPTFLDVSSFLFDFNLLYEIVRLAVDPKYLDFSFRNFSWYRQGRPLRSLDRLWLEKIKKESPLEIAGAVALASTSAVGCVWGVVQIVVTVWNAPLNRRKLKAEVEKLERENLLANVPVLPEDEQQIRHILRSREAEQVLERATERLKKSSLRITAVDVDVLTRRELGTKDTSENGTS